MVKINVYCFDKITELSKVLSNIIKLNKKTKLSKTEVYNYLNPYMPPVIEDYDNGWDIGTLSNENVKWNIKKHGSNIFIVTLPDPVPLNSQDNNKCKEFKMFGIINDYDSSMNMDVKKYLDHLKDSKEIFDVVSHPSHYTKGRKYEPRKVIADWDLNFNLGNAVKYIAKAGRKNDKIEDLKKAIQYIEFEIEECSKHLEYEELLNEIKNRPKEEQVKIFEKLRATFNIEEDDEDE